MYVLSVWLYRTKWEARKLGAVVLATIGVMFDVYGGSTSSSELPGADTLDSRRKGPTAPLLGDLLTLVASISYALYQVLYKRYAALPNKSEEGNEDNSTTQFAYESLSEASDSEAASPVSRRRPSLDEDETEKLPFGFYANCLTSCMGISTILSLGIGFPVLHWLSIERFALPPDGTTFWCIVGIAAAGVVFNSCFMVSIHVDVFSYHFECFSDPLGPMGPHPYICWEPFNNRSCPYHRFPIRSWIYNFMEPARIWHDCGRVWGSRTRHILSQIMCH